MLTALREVQIPLLAVMLLGACAAASGGHPADAHAILAPALAFRDLMLTAGPPLGWVSVLKRLA